MKYKINIIDEQKDINDLVRANLEQEDYRVYSFYTYDEALLHVDDEVHLWLIDVMLDKHNGFELLNVIKERHPDMPVILWHQKIKELILLLF